MKRKRFYRLAYARWSKHMMHTHVSFEHYPYALHAASHIHVLWYRAYRNEPFRSSLAVRRRYCAAICWSTTWWARAAFVCYCRGCISLHDSRTNEPDDCCIRRKVREGSTNYCSDNKLGLTRALTVVPVKPSVPSISWDTLPLQMIKIQPERQSARVEEWRRSKSKSLVSCQRQRSIFSCAWKSNAVYTTIF